MKELLREWDIGDVDAISPTPSGGGKTWFVRTATATDYVLKESHPARAEGELAILLELSRTRVPVAVPLMSRNGALCVGNRDGRFYCLYPRLDGEIVTEHYGGDAEARARRFGRAIGLLHTCFRESVDIALPQQTELIERVTGGVIPQIRENGAVVDANAIERIWRDAESQVQSLSGQLAWQLIHRDAHTANMLFSGDRLTGWLDFEMVRWGPRLFDVCYCASSILVEGFEDPERALLWPSLFRSMVRGYEEFLPLTLTERQAMYGMFVMVELLFIAFFIEVANNGLARMSSRLLCWLASHRDSLAA